jgi:hypothetical protein
VDERSLYASPFPYDTSLDAVQELFAQHATVRSVRLRRHLTSKDFKGSVFVELGSKEEADKVGSTGWSTEPVVAWLVLREEMCWRLACKVGVCWPQGTHQWWPALKQCGA